VGSSTRLAAQLTWSGLAKNARDLIDQHLGNLWNSRAVLDRVPLCAGHLDAAPRGTPTWEGIRPAEAFKDADRVEICRPTACHMFCK
jgi:hypothetical protein